MGPKHFIPFLKNQRHQQKIAVGIFGNENDGHFPLRNAWLPHLRIGSNRRHRPGPDVRMRKPKTRTLSRFGVQADTTAHLFDDTLADGQSQPGPLDKTVEFHETLEDRLLLLLGNPGTGVFDIKGKHHPVIAPVA